MLLRLLILPALVFAATAAEPRPWNEDVIYFVLTDRFFDGDPENNVPPQCEPALYDAGQKEITRYHGGDLRGLERAIADGYFEALGVTALWITPPVRNVWNSPRDLGGPKTGYHGYWAQDFMDIDPHLTSRRSLDGSREYPDSREGRMQHYKDFVALAHSRGLKVIQDIVCNHAGPVFFYDSNGNGTLDRDKEMEWIMPYRREGFYDFAKWLQIPEWNALPTMPGGPVTVLGRAVKTTGVLQDLSAYGRKGMSADSLGKRDGEEVMCDFFALRDFWTAPGSGHFDRLVDEFVEIYQFYAEEIGVDGFRVDTVKHVHREFWEAFTARLRAKLGPERAKRLFLFGEVYDGSASVCGRYTFHTGWPAKKEPVLDAVLNFPLCFATRGYLRHTRDRWGSGRALEQALKAAMDARTFNPTPGADGLNARQKMVNFVENHDGLNRFRVAGVSERANLLANAMTFAVEGIPCIYYGTEAALEDANGSTQHDSETGRMTFIPRGAAGRLAEVRGSGAFQEIAALARLRSELPALVRGSTNPLWVDSGESREDDGVFAFARYFSEDGRVDAARTVIVVFNASPSASRTGLPGRPMQLVSATGKPLIREDAGVRVHATIPAGVESAGPPLLSWENGVPSLDLKIPPNTAVILTGK